MLWELAKIDERVPVQHQVEKVPSFEKIGQIFAKSVKVLQNIAPPQYEVEMAANGW